MITNEKTRNRSLSIVIALMMVIVVFCITVQPVSAASKEKNYNSNALYMGTAKDKDGAYYIWAERSRDGSQTLKCSKSASDRGKILAKSKKKQDITQTAITNGETIYFAIVDRSKKAKKTTFYKTTVNKKKPTKLKTVEGKCEPATYYKGKLYYVKNNKSLQAYDVSKKTVKSVTNKFGILLGETGSISSYGNYIIRWHELNRPGDGYGQYLYNVATKKEIEIPGALKATIYGKNIYYCSFVYNSGIAGIAVEKSNLAGKKFKRIKTLPGCTIQNLSKKSLWFKDSKNNLKKLTYKTGKVTKAK